MIIIVARELDESALQTSRLSTYASGWDSTGLHVSSERISLLYMPPVSEYAVPPQVSCALGTRDATSSCYESTFSDLYSALLRRLPLPPPEVLPLEGV